MALGSGECAAVGVAAKAALLDRAAAAGLRVPAGFVIPHAVSAINLPGALLAERDRTWAVRSAFSAEDGDSSSRAGWFDSFLGVRTHDLPASVDRVRRSGDRYDAEFRRDVLVMAMVDAEYAGVAFSEAGTYDDVANVTSGLADRLVGGGVAGDRLLVSRLEATVEGWPTRLRTLLAEVRDEFGDAAWDVEWADDGTTCWLVQIRPITRATVRNETLTAANHAEILPRLPSHLMSSLITEAGPDLFGWYRDRVPGLPANRDFLHVVEGRPMINLSLLEDMMRHLGLPTKLVAESIGGGHGADHTFAPFRVARQSPSLVRLGFSLISAVVKSKGNRRRAAAIGSGPAASFSIALHDLRQSYVALVTGMFPLSSAIGPPLAMLRSSGTLLEHASGHRTVTVELAEARARLRGCSPADRPAELARFLADFGHRGVYESDIARPRYRDDPGSLTDEPGAATDEMTSSKAVGTAVRVRTIRGLLTTPIWWLASHPMAAREMLRHDAMRSFANIRDSLVAMADQAVEAGQLRHVDDLWLLDADETRRLDDGWTPADDFWVSRRAARAELDAIDVPHVVQRFDDPADWNHDTDQADGVLRGLALTTGRVTGRAWVLDEPSSKPPEGFDRATTILVARSIDAGWISTLADVAAVVVEIGGDLSHGSILVRELGMPAVTNVSGATRRIATGDELVVDAGAGTVRPT